MDLQSAVNELSKKNFANSFLMSGANENSRREPRFEGTDGFLAGEEESKGWIKGKASERLIRCPWQAILLPDVHGFFDDGVTQIETAIKGAEDGQEIVGKFYSISTDHVRPYIENGQPLTTELPILQANSSSHVFDIAFSLVNYWPGVLFFDQKGEYFFAEIPKMKESSFAADLAKVSITCTSVQDLRTLLAIYAPPSESSRMVVVQISDLHIGAGNLEPGLLRSFDVINRQMRFERGLKVAVVTGDIVDTPDPELFVRAHDYLQRLGTIFDKVFFVPGNHDLRKGGWLPSVWRFPSSVSYLQVCELKDRSVALVGFDSCEGEFLADGSISKGQLASLGSRMDNLDPECRIRLGFLHHHPIQVPKPSYMSQGWLRGIFSALHEQTVAMNAEDANRLLMFCESRQINYLFHGHKHTPHIGRAKSVKIFGCGSSSGHLISNAGNAISDIQIIRIEALYDLVTIDHLIEDLSGAGPLTDPGRYIVGSRERAAA